MRLIVQYQFGYDLEIVDLLLPYNRDIGDVSSGFWIGGDMMWCAKSEQTCWIPPSRIINVSKVCIDSPLVMSAYGLNWLKMQIKNNKRFE